MPDETPPTEQQPVAAEPPEENEPTEAQAPEVPEDLTAVDEEALRALYDAVGEHRNALRESARTAQDADAIEQTVAAQARIVAEINRRREEARLARERLEAVDALEVPGLPAAEPEPSLAGAGATAAQLAAASTPQAPTEQNPPAVAAPRPRAALLASAGTEVVPAGTEMNWEQFGEAIDRAKRGREGRTILASLSPFPEGADPGPYPRALSQMNGTPVNDALMREAVEDWEVWFLGDGEFPAARTAAICEPFDNIREIPDAFDTSAPVRGIFPSRPAGRGGYNFTPSGVLADVTAAVALWDESDQAAVDVDDSSTWKPCAEYTCPDSDSAVLEWIPACVTFDNTLEMSNPERVRNLNNALAAYRARVWEGRLLQRIDELSYGYIFSGDYGALPSVIEAVNTVLAQLTFENRQQQGRYVLLVPPGAVELLTIDRANRAYGAEQEAGDVLAYLRGNIDDAARVVETLDASLSGEPSLPFAGLGTLGNQAAQHSINYISGGFFRFRLVAPEAAIYSETGEMNAGTLRDANLIRQNKTGYFTEAGFFLTKQGPQPWATIDINLCADGSRAGLVTPTGCVTS